MKEPEESQAIKEYRQAYDEFFKDKPEPKDEEESKKRIGEFLHWYNKERKQSDTGKTPDEMYKEIYGREAPEPVELTDEDIGDEEVEDMKEFFDKNLWPKLKKDLKEATKKEACFFGFLAGTEISNNMLEERMRQIEKMSPEDIAKMVKNGENPKIGEESLWAEGGFMETLSPNEIEEKEKTIHKGHDEDMNYDCKKCGKKISAHNKDWHDGMCDDCFNEKYFPEDAQIFETDINEIKEAMKIQEKDNMSFWKWLKEDGLDIERFNKIVKEVTKKIDCTKCGNCCKEISPVLSEEDIKIASEKLNISKDEFIEKYTKKADKGIVFNLPCPFLKEMRCSIYESRPKDCRSFPNLDKDVSSRCHQFFNNAELCPIVFNVLENAKEEFEQEIYEFENPDI
ncbi:MAG: YkgJ family cysteine cluster protein [Nanoarchaeota archaeon]|nr:YkgJ family cysteine cluster protein [Nanoarchaeota archaeon]